MRIALALLVFSGCDPGWKIEGTVVDPLGSSTIPGASVALACPGGGTGAGPMPQTVVTDAMGRFSFGGVGGAASSSKCSLTISKAGFTTKTIVATDACFRSTQTHDYTTPCGPSDGIVTLAR